MKILSFDIGIRNMAICCLELNKEDSKVNIIHWDVLNLIELSDTETHSCSQFNNPKTKKSSPSCCTRKAKFMKNSEYYCEKHAKSSPFLIPTKETKLPYLKKQKLEKIITIAHSLFIFENNEEKWKKDDYVKKINEHYESKCLEPIANKKKKAGDVDLIEIGKNMKKELDKVNFDDILHIVIENQLSPLASRMKTIQGMLAQYFIMKYENASIHFVSSANKLKQFEDKNKSKKDAEIKNKNSTNPNYKEHKKDGIFYTKEIIEKNDCFNNWREKMNTRKKDDLADCFLQGLWFFKQQNIIFYADDLKIKIV
tara:strand:- start:3044 stop:3976 length:933 start_codon:yes stop_codon:yes gene_type:complete